jgi:hypothetical protein
MPDFRLILSPGARPCRFSSEPAVGSTGTHGIIPGHLPSELRMPRLALLPPARGIDLKRPDSRRHAFRGRELGETCHRPDPGPKGALAISACRSSLVSAGHNTDTPRVGQATIPRLSPTRRQTNSALRPVPNPRAERSAVWPELYLRAHRQVLA